MRISLTRIETGEGAAMELALEGSGGLADAPLLGKVLKGFLQQGYATVLVNLARVRGMDTSCWARLVSAAREVRRRGGRLILRRCSPTLLAELQAHRWEDCFEIPEDPPAVCDEPLTDAPSDANSPQGPETTSRNLRPERAPRRRWTRR